MARWGAAETWRAEHSSNTPANTTELQHWPVDFPSVSIQKHFDQLIKGEKQINVNKKHVFGTCNPETEATAFIPLKTAMPLPESSLWQCFMENSSPYTATMKSAYCVCFSSFKLWYFKVISCNYTHNDHIEMLIMLINVFVVIGAGHFSFSSSELLSLMTDYLIQ